MQLRFASLAVINLRRDLHPRECARAGRTMKKPAEAGLSRWQLGSFPVFHIAWCQFSPRLRFDALRSAFYPVLVHRLAVSLHASSPRSVTLPQLRFTSLAVVSLREDLHLQEYAHAGRTNRKNGGIAPPSLSL